MPDAAKKKPPGIFRRIINWFKDTAEWVQENLGDEAISKEIREDLGLNADSILPKSDLAGLPDFAKDLDPEKESFAETAAEIQEGVTALLAITDAAKNENLSAWDTLFLLGSVTANESIRLKAPFFYALGQLALILRDDPEELSRLDPAQLVSLVRGDVQPGGAERFHQRFFAGLITLLQILPHILGKLGIHLDRAGVDLHLYYGWDPSPDSPTPETDLVSMRALTMLFSLPSAPSARLSITVVSVPRTHTGPGLLASVGGSLTADTVVDGTRYRITTGGSGAFDLFIPLGSGARSLVGGGDPSGFIRLEALRPEADVPAFRIGEADHTRLDIGAVKMAFELGAKSGGFAFTLEKAALILKLGEGDGFLRTLSKQEIPIRFDVGVVYDTEAGLRLGGGTRAEVSLPVANSVLGAFTIHHADLRLGKGRQPEDAALELTAGLTINLGPFRATIDRVGFAFEGGFREGNLGFADVSMGFRAPSGIGLVLETKYVKGGGYLFIDRDRGEYAGVLEIKLGPINIKAIGILQTGKEGRSDWSLLLFLFGQFKPLTVPPGLNWSGAGGMIGLRRSVDTDKLQAGVRLGALDDLLFPKDPVADAPRLINQLRTIFPFSADSFTIGPFIELGFLDPQVVKFRAGVIFQMDRLTPGDSDRDLTRVIILGQIRILIPPEGTIKAGKKAKTIITLICDILGIIDLQAKTVLFTARLRDSKIVETFTITGMLVVRKDYGEKKIFVLAAGGFHPEFKDIPAGLPAPIDRLGFQGIKIASLKLDITGYFAITPNTKQFGIAGSLKGSIGPVTLEASLAIDALIEDEPYPRFIVNVKLVAQIKYKSHTLAGFKLDLRIEGPGYWHITGKIVFEILWWDIEIPIDKESGEKPILHNPDINLGEIVQAELARESAWQTTLPTGEALVTIAAAGSGTFVHPHATLSITQNAAPLGVTLQRAGSGRIAGANRFEVTAVRIGESIQTAPDLVSRPFARGQFFDLTDEQKLTLPSFEPFTAGVSVAGESFTFGPAAAADLSYETAYLEMEPDAPRGNVVRTTLLATTLPAASLGWQSKAGAAARSSLRERVTIPAGRSLNVNVGEVPLVAVDETTLAPTGFPLAGPAAVAPTAAAQRVAAAGVLATVLEDLEAE